MIQHSKISLTTHNNLFFQLQDIPSRHQQSRMMPGTGMFEVNQFVI